MAVTKSSMSRCKQRVIAAIGEGEEDNSYSGTVADLSSYANDEIRDAIIESDTDVCNRIIEDPRHPFRPEFVSGSPVNITPGNSLPSASAVHDKVELYVRDTIGLDTGTWQLGIQLKNRTRYDQIAADTSGILLLEKYYFIEHGRMLTKAQNSRIYLAEFTPDRTTFVLQSPVKYEKAVIAGAIGRLDKGKKPELFQRWANREQVWMNEISLGKSNLTDIEILRKQEGKN